MCALNVRLNVKITPKLFVEVEGIDRGVAVDVRAIVRNSEDDDDAGKHNN